MATESFVQQLTMGQNRLYGYIYSLIGDHHRAADVLQETNLVLWRKAAEFRPEADFIPWAFAIARFQVMANLRDQGRDRCILDPELLDLVGEELVEVASEFEEMRDALRNCLSKLPSKSKAMIDSRYFGGRSIKELAGELNKTADATKTALMRIRKGLRVCVQREMAKES
ncbi:MAG: sigma-70 family RNA polymerase sigma factor [Verrucomicrobiales bacterium]|nr:sigma-70 family RNA polymerase sigma factor [Verrucomicrobiales bacterium]